MEDDCVLLFSLIIDRRPFLHCRAQRHRAQQSDPRENIRPFKVICRRGQVIQGSLLATRRLAGEPISETFSRMLLPLCPVLLRSDLFLAPA